MTRGLMSIDEECGACSDRVGVVAMRAGQGFLIAVSQGLTLARQALDLAG